MSSDNKTRRPKAPTLRETDWLPHKERIAQLYIEEVKTLKDVQLIMQRDHGFYAEVRQYRLRLNKWKFDKNVKTKEMKAIVRRSRHRSIVETDRPSLRFRVRAREVELEKIERWMREHEVDERQLYAPSSVTSTPSAVDYSTGSEQDPPIRSPDRTPVQSPVLIPLQTLAIQPFVPSTDTHDEQSWRPTPAEIENWRRSDPDTLVQFIARTSVQSHPSIPMMSRLDRLSNALRDIDLDANDFGRRQSEWLLENDVRALLALDTHLVLDQEEQLNLTYRYHCCYCGTDNSWVYNEACCVCYRRVCGSCQAFSIFNHWTSNPVFRKILPSSRKP